jgi:sporulation protein YlmC with PRC-barrel domain
MKWILASTTALALTMGAAQFSVAQDAPAAGDAPAVPSTDDTMQNQEAPAADTQPATPETGTDAMDSATEVDPNAAEPDAAVTMDSAPASLDGTLSARDLVGANVIGPDGSSVGTVDDLVLDARGKIEQVIIADGAILGIGGKNVAISYSGATLAQDAEGADPVVRINMTNEALDAAAEFDKAQLEEQGDRLASSYIERDVTLASSDAQGEINDLRMDQNGTVKFAIIEFGGALDMGDSEVAVGFDKLSGAPEGEPMQLSLTEAELEASPKLDAIQPAAGN